MHTRYRWITQLFRNEDGASGVEYALVLSALFIASIGSITAVGESVDVQLDNTRGLLLVRSRASRVLALRFEPINDAIT